MTLHLPAEVSSPREARRHVRSLAADWPTECTAALQVLVDELVTNVVLHARTESTLVAHVDGRLARVEVHDRSRAVPRTRHFALDALTGRGLHLVQALAHRWGVNEHPDGKVVWFELECDRSVAPNGGDVS
jgi:anti-sigma regulatory factor (Ser/Thr protein kinase)